MSSFRSRIARRLDVRDDSGFTLLEAIVSFMLFVVVMGSAIYGIVNALNASHSSQQRVDAANVAQAFVAQARSNPQSVDLSQPNTKLLTANPVVGSGTNGNAASEQFTAVRYITFSAPDESKCTPGGMFMVNVLVYQGTSTSGKFLARSDSVVACPPS